MSEIKAEPFNDFEKRFHEKYILVKEITELVGVTRPAVFTAKEKGKLPGCINIGHGSLLCWERNHIMPFIQRWKSAIDFKRNDKEN